MALNHLEDILQREVQVAQALLGVLERQQQAIVQMNMEHLDSLVVEEQQLITAMQNLEKERMQQLEQAGRVPPRAERGQSRLALQKLVEQLPPEEAERLLRLGDTLRYEAETILNTNRRISILLNHSLRFVRESVKLLTEGHTSPFVDQKM